MIVERRTYGEVFVAITRQRGGLGAVRALHRHQELLLPRTRRMERDETRGLRTLDAGALSDFTDATPL